MYVDYDPVVALHGNALLVSGDNVVALLADLTEPSSVLEIQRFFDGFELVAPGVVFMNDWRPDPWTHASGRFRSFRAGVGRKP